MRFRHITKVSTTNENACLVLYFTGVNAISAHHENKHKNLQCVISIVFYKGKCDCKNQKIKKPSTKSECVKTLAPVHQSCVSVFDGTQSRGRNIEIS